MKRMANVNARWILGLGIAIGTAALFPGQLISAVRAPMRAARLLGRQPGGETLVPTGQVVRAVGEEVTFPGRPVDAALSPDGKTLAVFNSTGVLLMDVDPPRLRQTVPAPQGGFSFAGIAWSPDGRRLFASAVQGSIQVLAVAEG